MSEYVYAGLTSQTLDVFLQDSSSTTGQGLSGLVYNSSGLVASYRKGATGSRTAITLATQTVGGAYSSGGFVEIDATNMKGVYRLDLPNAAVDTEGFVTLYLYGATNLLPTPLRIDCRPIPVDVKKFGGTAGTFASGRPEVNTTHVSGTAQTAGDIYGLEVTIASYIDTEISNIQSRLPAALVSGRIDASVGAMATDVLTSTALAASAVTEIQSGLSTLTAAQVNAEVLDVLQVDTFAELSAVPAATSTLKDKITWLFMWARNKATQTSTQRKLYADDTTTVVSTETVSDDGTTYSKGEAS